MNNYGPPSFHDPNANPLPDANDIEQEAGFSQPVPQSTESVDPHRLKKDRRRLKWLVVGLLGLGLVLGAITVTAIVWTMDALRLTNPTELQE